jgi:hypothetical protein
MKYKLKNYFLNIFGILAIVFFYSGNVLSSEEALSLLIKAFEFSGENPSVISSCTAQFHVITKDAGKDTVSQKDIKILMVGNNILFTKENSYKCKRLLSTSDWQIDQIGKIWKTLTMTMGSVNQDSYIAFEWKPDQSLLERFRGTRDIRQIPEIQKFGRIFFIPGIITTVLFPLMNQENYSFPSDIITKFNDDLKKKNLSCKIAGEITYDNNAIAKVVEVRDGENCLEKYHIDISRGYLCPYMRYDDKGFSFEYSARNYFQEKNTSLYYPQFFVTSTSFLQFNQTEEFQLLPNTLQFNHPIPEKEFAIDIPENAYIHDWIPRKSFIGLFKDEVDRLTKEEPSQREIVQYRTNKEGTISFAENSYEIENLPWVIKTTSQEKPSDLSLEQKRFSPFQIFLISMGVLLILFALFRLWYKR